ncbi:muscarinic acetylcholine receptor M3-like [Erpetoichthys calabaricus]|uniref:muscarinic acetylcholine receptor M3-like n=1 Tax=Erpetoichthys calabaricus TaxID=27687 RepID=UPI00109FC8A7|nr:muscarinic acetylcholine receptor M3-like [Erpetoichthys calabaricus]
MSLTYNSTASSLILSSSNRIKAYQDTGFLHENKWSDPFNPTENGSFPGEDSALQLSQNATPIPKSSFDPLGGHTVWQVVLIAFLTGSLSLVTIIGNILVLLSFKVNKQLKTVNNYFLLSLAFADLIIGVISMNLYTTYIIMDKWALGGLACDLWLAIDYVASNASVMNLLVISFDRYFSVTRPLTYRAKRTTKRAGIMIGLAWSVSFILWAPAILFWQYFVGKRTVPADQCFIPFLSEPIITFCTAIAAFYLPVTIMTILYWRIYKETEKRTKELAGLQASGSDAETAQFVHQTGSSRSCSSYELTQSSVRRPSRRKRSRFHLWPVVKSFKSSPEADQDQSSSDSWNNNDAAASLDQSGSSDEEEIPETRAIYSIVLKLPGLREAMNSHLASSEDMDMSEDDHRRLNVGSKQRMSRKEKNEKVENSYHQCFTKMPMESMPAIDVPKPSDTMASAAKTTSMPISFKEAAMAKRFAARARTQITKRKRMSLVKEKKAAQTLSAILFAFIITWTPYNIIVLVNTFCNECIPKTLWDLSYWLCYVNSTVNPMCYALCNKTFRTTFKMILLCQWDKKKRRKQQFQQRQSVIFRKNMPQDS